MDKQNLIKALEDHKKSLQGKKSITSTIKGNLSGYDLTASGRWIGNLETTGETHKSGVTSAISSYEDEIETVIKKIDEVIKKIGEAEDDI